MPTYKVLNTPILHGVEGKKTAARYEIGDEIDLTEKEAAALGNNVEAVTTVADDKGKKEDPPADKRGKGKAETAPADDAGKGTSE